MEIGVVSGLCIHCFGRITESGKYNTCCLGSLSPKYSPWPSLLYPTGLGPRESLGEYIRLRSPIRVFLIIFFDKFYHSTFPPFYPPSALLII